MPMGDGAPAASISFSGANSICSTPVSVEEWIPALAVRTVKRHKEKET
jgi:hypothetical protein